MVVESDEGSLLLVEKGDLDFDGAGAGRCRGRLKVRRQPLVSWPLAASHIRGSAAEEAVVEEDAGLALENSGE